MKVALPGCCNTPTLCGKGQLAITRLLWDLAILTLTGMQKPKLPPGIGKCASFHHVITTSGHYSLHPEPGTSEWKIPTVKQSHQLELIMVSPSLRSRCLFEGIATW
jgi:hypothetical protein